MQIDISYAVEEEPLGTGGGLLNAFKSVKGEETFVLNGDSFFDISLRDLESRHCKWKSDVSLALRRVKDLSRYGAVEIDEKFDVRGFREKEVKGEGYINAGIYVLRKSVFEEVDLGDRFSFEQDFLGKTIGSLAMKGFPFKGIFIDVGTPEDFRRAERAFREKRN